MPFGWGKKKEDVDGNFVREAALGSLQGPTTSLEEYQNSLGRTVYMIMDSDVTAFLAGKINDKGEAEGPLADMLPAFSHMNRLTKITKHEAELLKLQYDYLVMRKRMSIPEHMYDSQLGGALEALRIYAANMVNDNIDGFKAKIATEQIKRVDVGLIKKKGLLG